MIPTPLGPLAFEVRGEGPPLVFWHSLLCDRSMWRFQAEELARDHRVVLIDGPGHGESPPCPREFSIEECADALVAVLDALGIEKAPLVGLSWGGMTAMRAALRHPARVASLALFDTSAEREPLRNRLRYSAMAWAYARWGLLPALRRRVLDLMFAPGADPELGRRLVEDLGKRDRAGIGRAVRAVMMWRTDIAADLPRIAVPTLVAVGSADRATPPARSGTIARAIPGARLHVIEGAGHLAALERPEEVTRLIRELSAGSAPPPGRASPPRGA